jgi:hypothetical protein
MNVEEEGEQRHLLQKVLPIITQEDMYMIQLLGRQKYIEIVKTTAAGWVEKVSVPFFFVHDYVGDHGEQRNNYLRFEIALIDFHAYCYYLCVMSIIFWV